MNDNIWFTYKARIRAQSRLASNDFHAQLLMVWYALVGSLLGILTLRYPKILGSDTDLITAFMSVAVLVLAMLVANRDFRGRALLMRVNYHALQELYRRASSGSRGTSQADIDREFQHLLSSVENHLEIDDKHFRVFHAGTLTRPPTIRERMEVYTYLTARTVGLIMGYLLPLSLVAANLPTTYSVWPF